MLKSFTTGLAFFLGLFGSASAAAATERPPADGNVIAGQYIVVYEDAVRSSAEITNRRENRLGFEADAEFEHAIKGFSAELSRAQARSLNRDSRVAFISRDRTVQALADVPLKPGATVPTGVQRILAATETTTREASQAAVAVIDTGIDLSHSDLNAVNGTNCISPGTTADDGDGHGTHVAGTIAAKNNGAGVIGVAPGTDVYAVKVLDDDGFGTTSSVVCGIDWVTANHAFLGIEVANMSLGGFGTPVQSCGATTDAMHLAICNSTAAGINYVAAAGNDGWDFDFEDMPDVPAAYPEVLTVTGVSDSDGQPGGHGGAPNCRPNESDDAAASFSSFALTEEGQAHTIAAPGVCIESTLPGNSYGTFSGTSMAAPHVAGAIALCIDEAGEGGPCAGMAPADVIEFMRGEASSHKTVNPQYGFTGDPESPFFGRYYGHLVQTLPPPPENTGVPVLSGAARHGETMHVSAGEWTGEPTFAYQWQRCGSDGGSCSDIPGAMSVSYELTTADIQSRVRALVTATNAGGTRTAATELSKGVLPLPPANTALPTISGTARDGKTFKVSDGQWSGEGPITYTYQWQRCGGTGTSCVDIAGATSASHKLATVDVDHRLRAIVSATNVGGTTSAISKPGQRVASLPMPEADPEIDLGAFRACAQQAIRAFRRASSRVAKGMKRSRILVRRANSARAEQDVRTKRQSRRLMRQSRILRKRSLELRKKAQVQGKNRMDQCRSRFL